jgi:hypothetical protein
VTGTPSLVRRLTQAARAAAGSLLGYVAARVRPRTALIVPVQAAEPLVAAWLGRERVDFDGAPLHVTVMYPFLPSRSVGADTEEAVAELARGIAPFAFALPRIGRFPGVLYLAPEPAQSFVQITERIQRRWPSCVPYEGAYDTVTPHVTVSFGDQPPADPARLERVLPITGQAAELWLIDQTRRGWRTRRRFPFGGRHQASTDPRSSGAGAGPAG